MKKIYLIVVLIATSFTHNIFAQDSTNQVQIHQLLSLYYDIKDALVAGNANTVALKAASFVTATTGVSSKLTSESNINSLAEYASKISQSKDLKKQRDYFSNFSADIIVLAKAVKLSDKPIYLAYCPMKKASWLTNEKAIKNPYYGQQYAYLWRDQGHRPSNNHSSLQLKNNYNENDPFRVRPDGRTDRMQ